MATQAERRPLPGRKKKNDLATKPISNAGFGPNPKVCVYLPSPQNLLDLALADKKLTKTKSFC